MSQPVIPDSADKVIIHRCVNTQEQAAKVRKWAEVCGFVPVMTLVHVPQGGQDTYQLDITDAKAGVGPFATMLFVDRYNRRPM